MNTDRQKKTRITKRRPMGIVLIVGILLAFGLYVAMFGSKKKPRHTTLPSTSAQVGVSTGWELADILLSHKRSFEQEANTATLPEWSDFNEEYFRALKKRRESVIVWSHAHPKPEIFFHGQVHLDIANGNTPERVKEIEKIQGRIFNAVRVDAKDAQVIVIEESGCATNEVLTMEVFVRISRTSFRDLYKMDVSEQDIRDMMRKDHQAATRSIMELSTPVTCGEEWPNRLETRLLQIQGVLPRRSMNVDLLIRGFNVLRSEIILIRTLEFLRAKNGSRGVIIQGEAHRLHIEQLAGEYAIALTTRPVP